MIVAQWTNEERTKSVYLNADNSVSYIERDHPSDVWSPPFNLKLESYHNSLKEVFSDLRRDFGEQGTRQNTDSTQLD